MRKRNRLVCGVGINDADYTTSQRLMIGGKWKTTWKCPFHARWMNMLQRCYSEEYQERNPTYKGCTVCNEWLRFSNFKRWMETQDWEDRSLDKDFLVEGNKVYSFIVTRGAVRGQYPLGVCYRKRYHKMTSEHIKPYQSKVNNQTGKPVYLGAYSTSEEAHQQYLEEKLKYCKEYLQEFKEEPLIIKGLVRIKDKIQYHIENNLELTSF